MALKGGIDGQMFRFTKLLRKLVEDAVSPKVMEEVGEETKRLVQQQAKLGNDYTGGKFTKLSGPYKEKRDKYSHDLAPRTRPKKSNVTATGQMVDSLEVSNIQKRSVELEASGKRYASPFGGGKKSNAEVGYWVEYNGRHWLGLNGKTQKRLTLFYDRLIKALTKKAQR